MNYSTGEISMPTEIPIHDSNDVTLGEVYRYMLAFESRTLQQLRAIDDRMNNNASQYLRADIYETRHKILQERIKTLEEENQNKITAHRAFVQSIAVSVLAALSSGAIAIAVSHIH